jgi:hypothetical protein
VKLLAVIRNYGIRQTVSLRAIRELAVFHPKDGQRPVSRKNSDPTAPRAQSLCANDSCTAGEFPAGTKDEGNPGELLPWIGSAMRTAGIARR